MNERLKHADNVIFGENLEQISIWRNEQKAKVEPTQQEIVAIVEIFNECATTKLEKLQVHQVNCEELIQQGNTALVLTILDEHLLASNSHDRLLTGQIHDYKDGTGMLVSEVLFQRFNTSIEDCQSRIDSFNEKMEKNWKVKLLIDLS